MADGINRIFGGGNNYGVGGFAPNSKNDETENSQVQQPTVNYTERLVNEETVWNFMANNNFVVAPKTTAPVGEVDVAAEERIAGYMENYEMFAKIVENEFGPDLVPTVMDLVMDRLIAMVA